MYLKKSFKKKNKRNKKSRKFHGHGRNDEWTQIGDVVFRQSKGGFTSSGNYYIVKVPLPLGMTLSDDKLINDCKDNTQLYCGIINPKLIGPGKQFNDAFELIEYIQKNVNLHNVNELYNTEQHLIKVSDFLPALKNGTFEKVVIDDHLAVSGELTDFNNKLKASNYENFTTI